MLPGAGDLALGFATVRELVAAHDLPYVAANLECDRTHPFPASRRVTRGGVDVAIVGVVGNAIKDDSCRATEPVAALKAAVEGLDADVIVVLSGQRIEEDEALAAAVPGLSLVVNGHDREQLETPRGLVNGGLLLAAGSRGKQLGVLTFSLTPGATSWRDGRVLARLAEQKDSYAKRKRALDGRVAEATDDKTRERLQKQADFMGRKIEELGAQLEQAARSSGPAHRVENQLLDMGADVPDHPATAALVTAAKARIEAAEPVVTVSALANSPFAGSSACAGCHAEQTKQWSGTGHARAYATLQATNNERDRACFACHVTGAFHPDGPTDPGAVAGLEAVGCESCHGPGKAHVMSPPTVDMIAVPDVATCSGCHDGKQDGGRFDFASYHPRIAH